MLVHICSQAEWDARPSARTFEPGSLLAVGFIHLSTPHQVHLPANRLFAGRQDLVLLRIDPARLPAGAVRWEPGRPDDPEGMLFPHLYGPLPVDAVTALETYRPQPDGRFAAYTDSA